MKVDLATIDRLRERADLTYEEAAAYLEAAGGDLVQALVMAERDLGSENVEEEQGWVVAGAEARAAAYTRLSQRIADVVRQGSSMRLVIERDGDRLANLPVAAGLVGVIWAPELAAVGAIAALASRCTLRLERC
ncbi:MAG: DUF4342 domain-containing protein [Bacillota bacterium]|jgi:hypothetical protein